MRTLALLAGLGFLVVACDDTTATNGTTADLSVAADLAGPVSACGHPGEPPVNSTGVGTFCQSLDDCKVTATNPKAFLCSNIGDPTTYFCTFQCHNVPGECGANALCSCQGAGTSRCGCVPAKCLPPDGGTA